MNLRLLCAMAVFFVSLSSWAKQGAPALGQGLSFSCVFGRPGNKQHAGKFQIDGVGNALVRLHQPAGPPLRCGVRLTMALPPSKERKPYYVFEGLLSKTCVAWDKTTTSSSHLRQTLTLHLPHDSGAKTAELQLIKNQGFETCAIEKSRKIDLDIIVKRLSSVSR